MHMFIYMAVGNAGWGHVTLYSGDEVGMGKEPVGMDGDVDNLIFPCTNVHCILHIHTTLQS